MKIANSLIYKELRKRGGLWSAFSNLMNFLNRGAPGLKNTLDRCTISP
jgi:hypothetical protein